MRPIYKHTKLLLTFLLCTAGGVYSGTAFAQDNLLLSARNVPQNMFVNPALAPESGFFAFPILSGLNVGVDNSFSYNSAITRVDGTNYLDNNKIVRSLRGKNLTMARFNMDLINFGFNATPKDFVGVSLRMRVHTANKLPGGVFEFLLDNPIGGIGRTFNMDLATNTLAWGELGVSYTRRIDDNWAVGGRVKLLVGAAGISSSGFGFDMVKQQDSYLLSGHGRVRMGNINAGSGDMMSDMLSGLGSNMGFGMDVGASYTSDDKHWSVNASISDFGAIFWNAQNSSEIVVRDSGKGYQFNGLGDLKDLIGGGFNMGQVIDSVYNEFSQVVGIDTLSGVKYTGFLPTTFQAMGTYAIDKNFRHNVNVGFIGTMAYGGKFQYALSAGYVYRTMNGRWQLMANYTFKPRDPFGIGIGVVYTSRKFQAFLTTENIIPAFSLAAAQSTNVRLGINFLFGR